MSRKLRTVSAAAVAAVALISLSGGTAQADVSAAAGKWIYLGSIKCNDTEDWNQDEIKIEVNGKRVYTGFFDPGDKETIHEYVFISRKATVKVVEIDSPDPDDLIGKHARSSGRGVLSFTNGADYKVSYKIGHS